MLALTIKKINFVLSPSPPLSIGFISLLIAKLKGAKAVYNVQEIYPDLLINQGSLKSQILINLLKKFERFIYNYSAAVTTIDQVFYSTILPRFVNGDNLKIIPNFVDTDLYKPLRQNLKLPAIFGDVNDKIKIIYAGNIGFYQDWDPLFFAAKEFLDENIEFWIIGEGVQKEYLISEVQNQNLTNIRIFPYQSREIIPIINNEKGNGLIHCREGRSRSSAILIAYLIHYHNMTYDEALDKIRLKRPIVRPNIGFERQLRNLEKMRIPN
jgi:glycosyltransferase involved in cell wall biosynthesis